MTSNASDGGESHFPLKLKCNQCGLEISGADLWPQDRRPAPATVERDADASIAQRKRDEHIIEVFKGYAYSVEYAKQMNHEFMTRDEAECNAEQTVQRFRLMLHEYDRALKSEGGKG